MIRNIVIILLDFIDSSLSLQVTSFTEDSGRHTGWQQCDGLYIRQSLRQ